MDDAWDDFSPEEEYHLQILLDSLKGLSNKGTLFLLYLYRSYKAGHLCIRYTQNSLEPDPDDFIEEGREVLIEGFKECICRLDERGHPLLVHHDNTVYYQKNYEIEKRIIKSLIRLTDEGEESLYKKSIDEASHKLSVSDEQREFIRHACTHRLSFLTGGPGTGKTFTVSQYLKVFWDLLDLKQKNQLQIALTAPTGKAASHLKQSLEKQGVPSDLMQRCHAKTLHSILGLSSSSSHPRYYDQRPIPYQLIIVDESSMIDARLMAALLSSIQVRSKVILVGDPDQLPPVDVGQVLPDLLQLFPQYVTELSQCFRAESLQLIHFSKSVKEGDFKTSWNLLKEGTEELKLIHPDKEMKRALLDSFIKDVIREKGLQSIQNIHEAYEKYQQFRFLSPVRKGNFGVESVNQCFLESLDGKELFIPIIITKNAHSQGLYNGDTGILILKSAQLRSQANGAYFFTEKGSYREIKSPLLPPFELAFCLSVHKSQGSEFDEVITLLPEGSSKFGREVLYTAATRTKKKLKIWGHKKTFQETLAKRSRKVSGLVRLCSACSLREL